VKKLKLNINCHFGCFGTFAERYVPGGYDEPYRFEQMLEDMSEIEGLEGLAVWYPGHPYIAEPQNLKKILAGYGLRVSDIGPDIWSDPKFRYGSISSCDKKIRKEALDIIKKNMDIAVELDAYSILLWPAHDGSDYVFQADYSSAWDYMVDSLNELGAYNPSVKIAIEPKQKDPRAKEYIEDCGKLMFFIKCLDVDNVGAALDLGHALFAQERPAESLCLYAKYGKLFQVHLNDNYRDADPDLVFGSISFWDTLEMFYYLGKYGFEGWLNIDTVTPRNDRKKMLKLAVKFIKDYENMANLLLEHEVEIDQNLNDHNYVDNMLMIRELLFGK
jgi:sugar phosphate isomerase/epimerase